MLVKDYQAKLLGIIQNYLDSRIVITYNFSVDSRSSYIALIQGKLELKDGSHLFFKEFIDLQEYLEKLSYSFHYQDQENNIIFRYDNAKHKPDLGYSHHKHINNQIIPSIIPEFQAIIRGC